MKRVLLGISLLGAAAVLGGCPIYPSQQEYQVCSISACYSCPDPGLSSACTPWPCQSDSDCQNGYVCDTASACVAGGSGTAGGDAGADASGDCTTTGCPTGEVCKLSGGVAQCAPIGNPGEDASSGSEGGDDASTGPDSASWDASGGHDSSPGDSGIASDGASDASDGASTTDGAPPLGPCNADAVCGGSGAKCIDGQCTPQVQLCSDGSQCIAAGSACVDGICEPHCSASAPCPTGTQCDLTRGVCNVNPGACSGSGTSTCQGGTTCVDGHCVPPCSATDSGPSCPSGQVCVNGGCLADQKATFSCANDGQSGQLATTCPEGQICVHHDCYAACGGEAGSGCSSNSVCKNVTIETGTYAVCGTTTTLGSDCDPGQGRYCASGKVCVDGYCE